MLHFVQSIFDECGLSYIWQRQSFNGPKSVLLSRLDVILKSQFIHKWQSDINMSTKYANYRMFKVEHKFEKDLDILEGKFLNSFSF